MRRDFYEIYEELNQAYLSLPRGRWPQARRLANVKLATQDPLRMVERAIHISVRELELGQRIRPDATHFLLVNLHQMISLPIMLERSRYLGQGFPAAEDETDETRLSLSELYGALVHDINLILGEAATIRPGEITGGSVLQAVSRVYDRLKTAASSAWG